MGDTKKLVTLNILYNIRSANILRDDNASEGLANVESAIFFVFLIALLNVCGKETQHTQGQEAGRSHRD